MTKSKKALSKAIERAGGQVALAKELGVPQSTVSFWLRSAKKGVPAERAADVERITLVPRHELRPDVFPSPARTSPDDAALPETAGHFSRYKHLRRDRYKSAKEVEAHIKALREEWS